MMSGKFLVSLLKHLTKSHESRFLRMNSPTVISSAGRAKGEQPLGPRSECTNLHWPLLPSCRHLRPDYRDADRDDFLWRGVWIQVVDHALESRLILCHVVILCRNFFCNLRSANDS